MAIESTRKRMVNFSTISLTDIVLLLLIFFLLTSSFVIQPGIKVKLPKAASGETEESDKLYITITQQKHIYVNQQRVGRSELSTQLQHHLKDHPSSIVVIRADKNLPLHSMIQIVDMAKLAGAQRFMIATQSIEEGR